jgi:MFS-type transporter involved in bile tolerance (Atg22 family)
MPAGSIGPAAASVLLLIILVSVCVAVADALLLGWLDKRLEDSYRL